MENENINKSAIMLFLETLRRLEEKVNRDNLEEMNQRCDDFSPSDWSNYRGD